MKEYSALVYNVSLNLVFNKEDAEDLTQEVFISIYNSLDKFKGDSKVSTWIYSISTLKSKEFLRNKTRLKRSGVKVELNKVDYAIKNKNIDHPGIVLEKKELATTFYMAIEKLPENQRIAYSLFNLDGKSYSDIADFMGLSVSSVESLIFRAKKKLRELLSEFYKNSI